MPVLPKSEEKNVNQYASGLYDQIGLFPIKQITESMNALFEPIRIQMKAMNQLFDGIRKAAEVVRNFFDNFIRNIRETFQAFFNPINNILKNIFAFIHRLWKSNFILIVKASEGDTIATSQLGKLWWHLMVKYFELEKMKGKRPNKHEFHCLVQETCWEVLKKGDQVGWFEAAKSVYYLLVAKLLVDYAVVCNTNRKEGRLDVDILDQKYRSSLSLYYGENDKPRLFVKTVAEKLGVSTQAVRNWIKSGKIIAIKISYLSKIRRAVVPAYLLPYQDNTLKELEDLRKEQENKKLHRIEGYSTISQIIKVIPISRKTLERWDKEGKLKPKRIKNIRYYSENDVKAILFQSQSPRVKALISEKNLAPALAS